MRSAFGWSYPAGCSGPPEAPDGICPLCGKRAADLCDCPECPKCGAAGCLAHLSDADLLARYEVAYSQAADLGREVERRERERPRECPGSHASFPGSLVGEPAWCAACEREF
jgi:hypothetical protein